MVSDSVDFYTTNFSLFPKISKSFKDSTEEFGIAVSPDLSGLCIELDQGQYFMADCFIFSQKSCWKRFPVRFLNYSQDISSYKLCTGDNQDCGYF